MYFVSLKNMCGEIQKSQKVTTVKLCRIYVGFFLYIILRKKRKLFFEYCIEHMDLLFISHNWDEN